MYAAPAMSLDFSESLLVLGALVAAAAALSGLFRGSILNASVLAVGGRRRAGRARRRVGRQRVRHGPACDRAGTDPDAVLRRAARRARAARQALGPARARADHRDADHDGTDRACARSCSSRTLDWAECFLLGAVLAPTDPVVTSTVVTARRVPGVVRHTLNLESGLNDGLALPLVLFFLVLAIPGGDAAQRGLELIGEVAVGPLIGFALAYMAGPRPAAASRGAASPTTTRASTRSGSRCSRTGSPTSTWGNGLIAAFVAGVGAGGRRARHSRGVRRSSART